MFLQAPHPTTILQQLPAATLPPAPTIRHGHVKEDLVELMMIQNAQMHQVIMNNMTMSALSSFGYSHPPPAPEVIRYPLIVQEEQTEDPEVYHHHYQPAPYPPYPVWGPLSPAPPTLVYQNPAEPLEPASSAPDRHRRAVPPPPPPSATRTVGADIPPASEYYDATERR
ncbi:proline-rich protein 29-like [Aplochiton taeniatus]